MLKHIIPGSKRVRNSENILLDLGRLTRTSETRVELLKQTRFPILLLKFTSFAEASKIAL
jgi:hypothetical protein